MKKEKKNMQSSQRTEQRFRRAKRSLGQMLKKIEPFLEEKKEEEKPVLSKWVKTSTYYL